MTSEPVGSLPRSPQIPSNSHKARIEAEAQAQTSNDPPEPLAQIVKGKVISKKTPWYTRFARSMIADDATNVGDYLLVDVIRPAAKNLIRDIIFGATERTLYGSTRGAGRRGIGERAVSGPVSELRRRYERYPEENASRQPSREQRARHDFQQITLPDREEAVLVLESLIDRIAQYRMASVTDFYDLLGVTGSFADQKWGWTDLISADVVQRRDGWLIDLPAPEPLPR